jgi:uncharacterized protein (TIGR02466 family)
MLNLANIFPILIGKTALDFDATAVMTTLAKTPPIPHLVLLNTSYGTMKDCLDDPELADLRAQIQANLDEYTERAGLMPVEIIGSWYNSIPPGQSILRHRHPAVAVSGAVYVDLPEDCEADLEFWDPNNGLRMHEKTVSERRLRAQAKTGDLILWPSWLEHETRKNMSQRNRVSISFNANYRSS